MKICLPDISLAKRQVWTIITQRSETNRNPCIGANVSSPTSKLASLEMFNRRLNDKSASDNGFGTTFSLEMSTEVN